MGTEGVRKHPRLIRNIDLMWSIESRRLAGRGKIVDLSVSGACIQIDQPITGNDDTSFSLICNSVPSLPTTAQLKWFRTKGGKHLCGVAFVASGNAQRQWTDWFEKQLKLTA